jgi:hypothetical protein
MPKREDCIDDILKAAAGRRDRKWAEEELEDLDARARESDERFGNYSERLRQAAREKVDDEMRRIAIAKRNVRMDMIKSRDLNRFGDAVLARDDLGKDAARLGAEAPLVGVNTPLFDERSGRGNQLSAAALGLGAKREWIGGAILDLERIGRDKPEFAGLDRLFFSREIEDDIFREKYELDLGDAGNPGRTKNKAALEIARVLHKWDKVKVNALNGEGAYITDYLGWMASTSHDPDRLRKAANQRAFRRGFTEDDRAAWTHFTLPLLDLRRTFGTEEDADKKLAEMWGGLIDGSHMDYVAPVEGEIFPNMARRLSVSRELHFKDADAWLKYNRAFGRYDPTEAWLHGMSYSADRYGLMRIFGSRPKEGFENYLAYLKNNLRGTEAREELNRWAPDKGGGALRTRFEVVSGEANIPVASIWSGVVNGTMAVQRLSKLGLTPFAMLQDIVTISRELARQGLGYFERNSGLFSDYFQGLPGSEKREVAELLHTGIMERIHSQTARFDIGEATSGRVAGSLARLEQWFFNITGITPMTANKRAGAERMMARHLGMQEGRAFADLGPDETRMLQAFGIGEKEWGLLGKVAWNRIGEEAYLTPDVAMRLPDADVDAYLKARSLTSSADAAAAAQPIAGLAGPTAVERARRDLAAKLWSYFAERGQFAVIEVGARERAILYQGTRPGTPLNLALRLLMQFKQFPTAMVTKAWGADVYGGATGMGRVAGLAELFVASTLFGALANFLNPIAKGQNPLTPWREQPVQALISAFNRGGAGSIYGDLLMGEWSRFGLSAVATLAGPTLGQTDKFFELFSDLTHPTKWKGSSAALAVRSMRENLPFANMIYTKAAVDYLIYYRLMEYLNPGYLERMEQTMRQKQGSEFWLRPVRVNAIGLVPALQEKLAAH